MKKAIVVGASSGIGKELARVFAKHGYEVGLMARRIELLEALENEIPTKSSVGHIDLSQVPDAIEKLRNMIQSLQGVDLVVINSGIGFLNPELDWSKEQQTLAVNVYGFCALAGEVYKSFAKQGHGHLVGISSTGESHYCYTKSYPRRESTLVAHFRSKFRRINSICKTSMAQ